MSATFIIDAANQFSQMGYNTSIMHDELKEAILEYMHLPNSRMPNNPWIISSEVSSTRFKGLITLSADNKKDHLSILVSVYGTKAILVDIEKI